MVISQHRKLPKSGALQCGKCKFFAKMGALLVLNE